VDRQGVITAVESLTYSRGFGKNVADAFRHVTDSMFTTSAGDRPDVPNVVSSRCCSVIFRSEVIFGYLNSVVTLLFEVLVYIFEKVNSHDVCLLIKTNLNVFDHFLLKLLDD